MWWDSFSDVQLCKNEMLVCKYLCVKDEYSPFCMPVNLLHNLYVLLIVFLCLCYVGQSILFAECFVDQQSLCCAVCMCICVCCVHVCSWRGSLHILICIILLLLWPLCQQHFTPISNFFHFQHASSAGFSVICLWLLMCLCLLTHVFVCVSCEFCIFCLFPFFLLSKFCINYLFNKMMMITITIKHL